jgi:hypothetical protein
MPKILVDIPVLENSSGEVHGVGGDSHDVGKTISSHANVPPYEMDGAPDYRHWMGNQCWQVESDCNKISHTLSDLSRIIKRKATDFKIVDNEGVAGMQGAVLGAQDWANGSSDLLTFAEWLRILLSFPWLFLFGGGLLSFLLSPSILAALWKGKIFGGLPLTWFPTGEEVSIPSIYDVGDVDEGEEVIIPSIYDVGDAEEGEEVSIPSVFGPLNLPTKIPINTDEYTDDYDDDCVAYAKFMRGDLGNTGGPGAEDYITKFKDYLVPINSNEILEKQVAEGYAIVWEHTHPYLEGTLGAEYGHVAIVERVEGNFVWISQRGVPESERLKKLDINYLLDSRIHVIGPT